MKRLLCYFISVVTILGCERVFFEFSTKPEEVFDACWEEMDLNYAYFELKQIDWDSIYDVFRPRINNKISDQELFNILSDMIRTLDDRHNNLYRTNARTSYSKPENTNTLPPQNIKTKYLNSFQSLTNGIATATINGTFLVLFVKCPVIRCKIIPVKIL